MTPEEKIAALRHALKENVRLCGFGNCEAIATWHDYETDSYACDEHRDSEIDAWYIYEENMHELPQARLAIAVLAETA